jgi:hypothetical protein
MTEITIKITEAQLRILIAMLNQVQVRLSEAPDFLDLKKRLDMIELKEP